MTQLNDFKFPLKGKTYKPLIIGGMGVDISTADLALVACELGGIGHISDAMSPYVSDKKFKTKFQNQKQKKYADSVLSSDKSQVKWDLSDVWEATKSHVEEAMGKKIGSGAIFINVMEKLTMGAAKVTLEARLRGALDGGIDGITLSAGLHKGTLKLIENHPRYNEVAIGVIVSSVRALSIFLRSSMREGGRLPDYIIVEGPLAGGHLGFGEDWRDYSLKDIVLEVINFLKEKDLSIAVIPAGGIFTGTDAVEYLELGCAAVQVATRFTISKECGLPLHVKQEYVRAKMEDIEVNSLSPTGYLMRMLKSSPCINSNIRPNCEALGYMLDGLGHCAYIDAYEAVGVDEKGKKLPVETKMCICYHFMKCTCYTCGENVTRLKDTTIMAENGEYILPSAAHIFNDYLYSEDQSVSLPDVSLPAANDEGV